jgi:MFS family permease
VSKAELVGSLSWLTVPALVGPVVGPPLGGFITTYFQWRWIFWINVPIGILGLLLATVFIPNFREEVKTRFDSSGFVLSGAGLAAFMTGSTSLGLGFLPTTFVLVLFFGGLALILAYIWHERRTKEPIMDLSLLLIPTFGVSMIGAVLFRISIGATPFLLPLLFQVGFGMTPFQSGSITFASAVGAIAMKFIAPPLLRRYGFRTVLLANSLIAGAFVALPATFTATTPVALMTGFLLISGLFRSLQFTSVNALTFADVPPERISRATTLSSVAQQLSISLGVSIGAISLEVATHYTGGTITAEAFTFPFILVGVLATLAVVPFLFLDRNAGDEMSGRRRIVPDPVTIMRERA